MMKTPPTPVLGRKSPLWRTWVFGSVLLAALSLLWAWPSASFAADVAKSKLPNTPEAIEAGKKLYFKKCSFCHGLTGGGDGPVAEFLWPRPRNFQSGVFKFRTTESGYLPTDEDLFRTVSRGIPGTAMPSWDGDLIKTGLSEEQRWQVIYFIQTLSDLWTDDEEYKNSDDPEDKADYRYNRVMKIADPPASTPELIEKGKKVFDQAKCWECHGTDGRGNGKSAKNLKDDWGFRIFPRDLTAPWTFKAGTTVQDIFTRFTTGINGTPMPSFASSIKEDDRWALAAYVATLQRPLKEDKLLRVRFVQGDLPQKDDDPVWKTVDYMDVRLTGQVLFKPRWQNFSINNVMVQALYNDKDIVFRLEWDDRFEDTEHQGTEDLHQTYTDAPGSNPLLQDGTTYVDIFNPEYPYEPVPSVQGPPLRDALMVQFPVKLDTGTKKPHFLNGNPGDPVNLWYWKSDLNADPNAKSAVVEMNATGIQSPFKVQADDKQAVFGKARYDNGRWILVIRRTLITDDRNDVQFSPGVNIPIAFNAWDGTNGEQGTSKSISTWRFVQLEMKTPPKVWILTLTSGLVVFGIQVYARKKVRSKA